MGKYWITTAFLLLFVQAFAQFTDSTHYYLGFTGTGNINKTNTADSYLLNNGLKFGVRDRKVSLNFNNSWLFGKQDQKLTNNDYTTSLDFNLNQKKTGFYYWGLGNYTTSYSLKIINQMQTGLGFAYTFFDDGKNQLNLSNGILYEASKIRLSDTTSESYQTYRNSLRLYFKFSLGNAVVIDGIGFLQNSLNYKEDYIIRTSSSLSFKINRWLSLNTNIKYNDIAKTDRQNLLLSYGFKADLYF
ncbi:DUF481 domain-containing protein [Desertivirga arenae]|uniref:DUF481 domain-containing protein n=1 Tax=Desertivirga arenae TaxID=2810309 RepID=UPI001A96BAA8|nr:DUF481 domain-containing protein [Pedobacter sp. SYSU D00823]